jgi:hypothetical protein
VRDLRALPVPPFTRNATGPASASSGRFFGVEVHSDFIGALIDCGLLSSAEALDRANVVRALLLTLAALTGLCSLRRLLTH